MGAACNLGSFYLIANCTCLKIFVFAKKDQGNFGKTSYTQPQKCRRRTTYSLLKGTFQNFQRLPSGKFIFSNNYNYLAVMQ